MIEVVGSPPEEIRFRRVRLAPCLLEIRIRSPIAALCVITGSVMC